MNELIIAAAIIFVAAIAWLAKVAWAADNANLRLLSTVGIIHNPGHIAPGLDGVQESQRLGFQYGAAVTTHQFTFPLLGAFTDLTALAVSPGAWISAKSGGSASTKVLSIVVDSVTLDEVKVTCVLDAAPGGGQTTTVACSIQVAGKAAR